MRLGISLLRMPPVHLTEAAPDGTVFLSNHLLLYPKATDMKSTMNENTAKKIAGRAASSGPGSIMKFLTIFLLSSAILISTFLILRPGMKTLDLYHSFGDEYAYIQVTLEPEGIVTVDRTYQEDGVVHALLGSVAEGETQVQVKCYNDIPSEPDPDTNDNYSASFYNTVYVNRFGMIYTASYDFHGVRALIMALGLVFLASAILLFHWYLQSRRHSFFSYKTILDFGLTIYFLVQALVLLGAVALDFFRPDLQIRGQHFFVLCGYSMSMIVILSFPILFIFSLMLSISNLVLIRREGRRFSNTLGILLSAVLMIGILACVYMVFMFPSTLDFNTKDAALVLIRGIISTIFFYFECNLFSTLVHCQRAGHRRWADTRKTKRSQISFDKDYLIILGCGIREDGTLYPLLKGRADCAIDFYRAQEKTTGRKAFFVPSGGQGPDECMPEGEAIKNYLLSQGIPAEQILPETKSVNTLQNMKFSKEILLADYASTEPSASRSQKGKEDTSTLDRCPNVAFSTTNFHVYRAGILASDVGLNADGMGARTKWYFWPNALIREFIGMLAREWKLHLAVIVVITAQAIFSGNIQWLFQIF